MKWQMLIGEMADADWWRDERQVRMVRVDGKCEWAGPGASPLTASLSQWASCNHWTVSVGKERCGLHAYKCKPSLLLKQ